MRLFAPGDAVSPSGAVVVAPDGRSPRIDRIAAGLGRGQCTWCAGPVVKPRLTWCSEACVEEYRRRMPSVLRCRALRRHCTLPTFDACGKLRPPRALPCRRCGGRGAQEVDHTHPIVEGGDPWAMSNLRVLCSECHREVTAELHRRRAAVRRGLPPPPPSTPGARPEHYFRPAIREPMCRS